LDNVCIDWQLARIHRLFDIEEIIKKEESMRITAFLRNEKAQVMFSIIFELFILGMVGTILL